MGNLENALNTFLILRARIEQASNEQQNLQETYNRLSSGALVFGIEDAERAYKAKQDLLRQQETAKKLRAELTETSGIIKAYLDVIPNKLLRFNHETDRGAISYSFGLNAKGEITYNQP